MTSIQELYGELWAEESALELELGRSLDPRGTEWLFEAFAALGPKRAELVVDVGSRDAKHAIRIVQEHGLRAVALDPVPLHIERARQAVAEAGVEDEVEIVEAGIEAMPLADGVADWIWCRDVLVHVDQARGLAECARILRPDGRMLAYVTLATELLEPREAKRLFEALAIVPESVDSAGVERCAAAAGLKLVSSTRLEGEWRERMIEDGTWNPGDDLLRLSRLQRRKTDLVERYGERDVAAREAGKLWGIYQLLGKLCPTVYVWERGA
jgi:ubiquinone/menaquinone biosynthesis C-methylase UbiE